MHALPNLRNKNFQRAYLPGGVTYLKKGDMDVRRTRAPFSHPFKPLNKTPPLFSIIQFHKTLFLTKNHKFQIFCSKYLNLAIWPKNRLKSSAESLNLVRKSVLRLSNSSKKLVQQAPKFCRWSALQAPAKRWTSLPKPKLSTCPPPPGYLPSICDSKIAATSDFPFISLGCIIFKSSELDLQG